MLWSSEMFRQIRLLGEGVFADVMVMPLLLQGPQARTFVAFPLRAKVVIDECSLVLAYFGLTLYRIILFSLLTANRKFNQGAKRT